MKSLRHILGEEHPNTLLCASALADLYRRLDRLDEAESIFNDVIQVQRRILGDEHPSTLRSINNLANLYWMRGRWEDAAPLYEKALESFRRFFGEEHPETQVLLKNLALVRWKQGRREEAAELHDLHEELKNGTVWDPGEVEEIIPRGSTWKYLHAAAGEDSGWRRLEYDDHEWKRGEAPLGCGHGAIAIDPSKDVEPGSSTTYFRRIFQIDGPERFQALKIRLRRDAGAAVNINDREVVRDNLATDATVDAPGPSEVSDIDAHRYFVFLIPPNLLLQGRNVIAVEVQSLSSRSPHGVFDLAMEGRIKKPGSVQANGEN